MIEADLYQPIRQELEELFTSKGKPICLEVTADKGLSEKLKQKLPEHREIVFAFLKKRPDLFGFIEGQFATNLITVEVKGRIEKIDDIYQAKLYKEVFDVRYLDGNDPLCHSTATCGLLCASKYSGEFL